MLSESPERRKCFSIKWLASKGISHASYAEFSEYDQPIDEGPQHATVYKKYRMLDFFNLL